MPSAPWAYESPFFLGVRALAVFSQVEKQKIHHTEVSIS